MFRHSTLVALICLLVVSVFGTAALAAPKEKSVLFICIMDPSESDALAISRLEGLGLTVTALDHLSAGDEDPAKYGLLMISSSTSSSSLNVLPEYMTTKAPIFSWEHALMDELLISIANGPLDAAPMDFVIVAPKHPIAVAAGLSGKVAIFTESNQLHTAVVECGTAVAMIDGTDKLGLLAIEKGEKLADGSPAPARRVQYAAGDICWTNVTADGWKLFDAGVKWAMGK